MAEVRELQTSNIKAAPKSSKELQPNPFMTYRDPQTGRWIVVKPIG